MLCTTEDLDFSITPNLLNHCETSIESDSRFVHGANSQWCYRCTGEDIEGVGVAINCLDIMEMSQMDKIVGTFSNDNFWVASLQELAILKAEALVERSEAKDALDLL
jgi:hypothetical protein